MSLDLFACHDLKLAVLGGDIEAGTASVLCALPKTLQIHSLNRYKTLPDAIPLEQLKSSVEAVAVNLVKTTFDKSNCSNCLHNTNNAIERCGVEFKPNLCLFVLCAQHSAKDDNFLSQRTVLGGSLQKEVFTIAEHVAPTAPAPDTAATQDIEPQGLDFGDDAQMDVGEPDSTCDGEPPFSRPGPLTQAPAEGDVQIAQDAPPLPTAAEMPLEGSGESLTPKLESYVDIVRNAWWRNALKHRIAINGRREEMQNFLLSCFATGHVPDQTLLSDEPASLFGHLGSKQAEDAIAPMTEMLIDTLPLEVVGQFLRVLKVDLLLTGATSSKLMSALPFDALEAAADHFAVENTDEMCDAYDAGSEAFGRTIALAIGEAALQNYIPLPLRP